MKRVWPLVVGLALILGGAAPSAQATINMTGPWVLLFANSFPGPRPATVVQTGTTVTVTVLADTFKGTIDSLTGAFALSDNAPCQPLLGIGGTELVGTVAADGFTLSGSLVESRGLGCDFAQFIPATGTRACTDDTTCDPCSACDLGLGACVPTPAATCRLPAVSAAAPLTLETNGPRLGWKWTKGQATTLADFGDPLHTDTYTLCVYNVSHATASTLFRAAVPAGTNWQATGTTGFTYKDNLGGAGGVMRIGLKTSAAGRAKIRVAAMGSHLTLPMPTLPLALPVAVQLRGHGECWGAGYLAGGIKTNTAREFRAKSSPSGAFLNASESF